MKVINSSEYNEGKHFLNKSDPSDLDLINLMSIGVMSSSIPISMFNVKAL